LEDANVISTLFGFVLVASVGAFGLLGFLLGRFVWPQKSGVSSEELTRVRDEATRYQHEAQAQRSRAEELTSTCAAASKQAQSSGEEVARLSERVGSLSKQIESQTLLLQSLEVEKGALTAESNRAGQQIATLTEREKALAQQIQAQAKQLQELQQQLKTEFENIANRILKATTAELSESSRKALATTLDPFRERLQELQKKVETTYESETREVLSLKEHIKLVVDTSHAIGTQADGLAKALRGDSQRLGRWGELTLERTLETAGLQEGREYVTQGRGLKLRSEEGGLQKPDVIIRLPEERSMIIDSKTPLASYERMIAAQEEDERASHKMQFVRDFKGHIDELSRKRYQENPTLRSHECVIMFVPIEGALAAAVNADPELFTYAWERQVVVVGPPTLLMTLRTVGSIWRYQQQGDNAREIARLAGELCDKISNSMSDLNAVAEKMGAALSAHGDAMKRLFTGRGNAITIGDKMKALGVKAKKPPTIAIDGLVLHSSAEDDFPLEAASNVNDNASEVTQ
jgi:DNA recombination protein RmuC